MEKNEIKELKELIELLRREIDKLRVGNFSIQSQLDSIEQKIEK